LHTNENIANGKVGVRKLSEDEPANVKNLAVGDLVVIHATPKGSALEADEIKFSRPPKPKS
jgi:sialic acid synthase SpsE